MSEVRGVDEAEIEGNRKWYDRIARDFQARYEGLEGLYYYEFEERIFHEWVPGHGQRVLDLGCGAGRYALPAAKRAGHVVGVDASAEMIALARERAGGDTRVEFHLADARALQFPDGDFDAAVSVGLFEYLSDPLPFFQEARRVLKPGGLFAISFHNSPGWLVDHVRAYGRKMVAAAERLVFGAGGSGYYGHSIRDRDNYYTPHRWRMAEMRAVLEQAGFEIVTIRTSFFDVPKALFFMRAGDGKTPGWLARRAVAANDWLGSNPLTRWTGPHGLALVRRPR